MSEQLAHQYQKEDDLPDTPEQALENWTAKSNSLAYIVPEVARKLEETGQLLYQAQEAARARGDLAAVDQIGISYANMERMANQVVQLDAAKDAAVEVIKAIEEDRQKVIGEKEGLETGINELAETGETDHPLLSDLSDALVDHWSMNGFHCDCPGCMAMDNGWYDCIDHDDVNDWFYALMSADAQNVPTELREELGSFMKTWAEKWNAHLNELREQEKAVQAEYDEESEAS